MSKTRRFEIYGNEPNGTTFEDGDKAKFAGPKNTKRKARFGVENDEPHGTTFEDPEKSHIQFPNADTGKVMGVKTIAETKGQGEYEPEKAAGRLKPGGNDYSGGSVGVGKSSPKHGKMRISQGYRA